MPASGHKKSSENGNAFIFILIAIALFGALAFTFTRGAKQGTGNISKQQAKVAAQEIINYARLLEGAVDRVRRNGCSESQLNFENAVVAGYSNTSAPTDGSCDIFETTGGRAIWATPPTNSSDDTSYLITGGNTVPNVGNNASPDLVLLLNSVDRNVCIELNNYLGVDNPGDAPPQDSDGIDTTLFTGSFAATEEITTSAVLDDVSVACITDTSPDPDTDHFYSVLLAR